MTYKLKEKPEKIFWSDTFQFAIVDEEGKEIDIRIGENSKFTETFMWHESGGWDEIKDPDIINYINEIYPDEVAEFEYEFVKEEEKKMGIALEKFISEKGEIDSKNKFEELISELRNVQDYSKNHSERFYLAYFFVMRKLKLNISTANE